MEIILKHFQAGGLDRVIAFDLTLPGYHISAVRMVVPELEGYMFAYYVPGYSRNP